MVLVLKKDGKLQYCIDLRRLNGQTVKNTYSLPWIDEMLDCLNGTVLVHILRFEIRVLAGRDGRGL